MDAYRTDAKGLESLDLAAALPGAVVVVEWGRSLVEEALLGPDGSWLDVQLIDERVSGTNGDSAHPGTAAQTIITDFSESEEDLVGGTAHCGAARLRAAMESAAGVTTSDRGCPVDQSRWVACGATASTTRPAACPRARA